jgi:hypothetical protein
MRTLKEGWFVKSVIVALALVLLMAGPVGAQIISCERFDRSNTDAPQFVRDWLEGDSKGLFVFVCGRDDYRTYVGASDLMRDGNVCRYSGYVLNLSGTSPSRLERTATLPLTYMLASQSETCPSPSPGTGYAQIFHDIPRDIFERLARVWYGALASPASFDRAVSWALGADKWRRQVRSRLREVILQNRSDRLAMQSVMRRNFSVWKSYDIDIKDPDHFDQFYAVTVSRFGWVYAITDVQAGMY